LLALLFTASGCSTLIYEIVWLQLLQLTIGASAVSTGHRRLGRRRHAGTAGFTGVSGGILDHGCRENQKPVHGR
jgi:hypothetical protein